MRRSGGSIGVQASSPLRRKLVFVAAAVAFAAASGCGRREPAKAPSAEEGDPEATNASTAEGADANEAEAARDEAAQSEATATESPAAEPGAASSNGAEATPAASAGGAIELDDDLDADIAELAETAKGGELDREPTSREIVYRVTPKGLVIEIDGFHLRPRAQPFKDKHGAYGVELIVTAESFDGRQYWVDKPKEGPLSIAGKIESKNGKSERFADQRQGEGEQIVHAAAPQTFRQRWPGRGQPKLWWGQTLTLEVGLWGMRADSGRERPVRRLFVVKMVGGNDPQAVISPPTVDWGT